MLPIRGGGAPDLTFLVATITNGTGIEVVVRLLLLQAVVVKLQYYVAADYAAGVNPNSS